MLPASPSPFLSHDGSHAKGLPAGITDTRGWSDEDDRELINKVKKESLDWDVTTGSAKWWDAFESEQASAGVDPEVGGRIEESFGERHGFFSGLCLFQHRQHSGQPPLPGLYETEKGRRRKETGR